MSTKRRILLHTCCAPCMSHVYELLFPEYEVTAFYFNPNIFPPEEYELRIKELRRFSETVSFKIEEEKGREKEWSDAVSPLALYGERSPRCWTCYRFRLEETFRKAAELGFDLVGTCLSISPYKDAGQINRIGLELQEKFGIEFMTADFKKKNGYKRSLELSALYGFYRQDYCGCIYSKMERDRESEWAKKVMEFRKRERESA